MSYYETNHAVVTRALAFDDGEAFPLSLLEEVAPRRTVSTTSSQTNPSSPVKTKDGDGADADGRPTTTPELKTWVTDKMRAAIGSLMKFDDVDKVNPGAALSNLGLDSFMGIQPTRKLQRALKMKISQALT